MASKMITLDNLGQAVQQILNEYSDEVSSKLDEITQRVGKKGAELLKAESLRDFPNSKKHKKRYGQTWTSKAEVGRLYTTVTIYNRQAGLPHLLEHGHVSSNGTGRDYHTDKAPVTAREHIAPVAERIEQQYEKEVISKL